MEVLQLARFIEGSSKKNFILFGEIIFQLYLKYANESTTFKPKKKTIGFQNFYLSSNLLLLSRYTIATVSSISKGKSSRGKNARGIFPSMILAFGKLKLKLFEKLNANEDGKQGTDREEGRKVKPLGVSARPRLRIRGAERDGAESANCFNKAAAERRTVVGSGN